MGCPNWQLLAFFHYGRRDDVVPGLYIHLHAAMNEFVEDAGGSGKATARRDSIATEQSKKAPQYHGSSVFMRNRRAVKRT